MESPPREAGPLLEVWDLHLGLRRGRGVLPLLQGVTLAVRHGESVGLVGESGSGKTLTARAILGLLPPSEGWLPAGRILFADTDLLQAEEKTLRSLRGNRMAMVFQDPRSAFNPYLKLSTQLIEGLVHHRGIGEKEALERAVHLLRRVGIPEAHRRIHDPPHRFSGGMLQRVMIAMALMTGPELLVADEPTSALDVTLQAQILRLLDDLRKEFGTAVLFITHDLAAAAEGVERLAVLYAGGIVEHGPTERIMDRPAHPYTRALFHALPSSKSRRDGRLAEIPGRPPRPGEILRGCPFAPRCAEVLEACRSTRPPLRPVEAAHEAACFRAPPAPGAVHP